jgi:putative FmdB family regulatory protein
MPLYEYQCESCGRRFERIQKFSDPPVDACPFCSGAVKKLLSSPAIQFKGSGWYITDYAKKSGADSKPAAATDEKKGAESTETKTESKTGTKESKPADNA